MRTYLAALAVCGVLYAFPSNVRGADDDVEVSEPHIMTDGTISWEQPDSSGPWGYEGYCGQTAAANIVSMLSHETTPEQVRQVCYDKTPGSRPATLAQYLSYELNQVWDVFYAPATSPLATLKKALEQGTDKAMHGFAPVAILLKVAGFKQYHWVTVVKITAKNKVIFNQYGSQYSMGWSDFKKQWGLVGDGPRWRKMISTFGIRPYTMVSQNYHVEQQFVQNAVGRHDMQMVW